MLVVLICFGMNIKLMVSIFLLIEQSETFYNNTYCMQKDDMRIKQISILYCLFNY